MLTRFAISIVCSAAMLAGIPPLSAMNLPRLGNPSVLVADDSGATSQPLPVTEASDAFHYNDWQGTAYDGAYTEWWYFNLYDNKHDLEAIFSYQVVDPANVTGQGTAFTSAAVYHGADIVNTFDLVPLSSFAASYSSANVELGKNRISVLDLSSYRIRGASENGRVSWNLQFDRASDPWFAADRVNVAPEPWEQMSWLLYMPRAHVSGTVVVDGHSYPVECSGYHDHNWGEWNMAQVRWNWAQHSEPGLSFELGDFIGNPNGRATIDVHGHRMVFSASQYKLVHTKWDYDTSNHAYYPIQSVFTADNGQVHVSVTMDVVKTDPLPVFPGQIIYEQPTHFTGLVTGADEKSPEADIRFEGEGFKEYTAVTNSAAQPPAN